MKGKLFIFSLFLIVSMTILNCTPQLPQASEEEMRLARTYFQTPFNIINMNWDELEELAVNSRQGVPLVVSYPRNLEPSTRMSFPRIIDDDGNLISENPSTPSLIDPPENFIKVTQTYGGFDFVVQGPSMGLIGTPVAGLSVDANIQIRNMTFSDYSEKRLGAIGVMDGIVQLYANDTKDLGYVKLKNVEFSFNQEKEIVYRRGDVVYKPINSSQELLVIPHLYFSVKK